MWPWRCGLMARPVSGVEWRELEILTPKVQLKQCKMTIAYNSAYVQTETLNFTFDFVYFDAERRILM